MTTKVRGGVISPNTVTTDLLARQGTAGQYLTSGGPGADPSYTSGLDQTAVIALIDSENTIIDNPPVRQAALYGPVTSTGLPDFLPATATGLILTTQNLTTTPLTVNAANGPRSRNGSISVNLSWTLPDASTSYLYVDVSSIGGLTAGSTTLAPVYQYGGSRSTSNQQATFNISEMYMSVGNGTTAPQTYRVFIGEAVTSGGNVTSTTAYAYQGYYQSPLTAISGGTVQTNFAHNIGVQIVVQFQLLVVNSTAEFGFTTGQAAAIVKSNVSIEDAIGACTSKNNIAVNWLGTLRVTRYDNGVSQIITAANWRWQLTVRRGW